MSEQAGKYARFEFERRFLVEQLPGGVEQERSWRITDRYIENTQLRLRRMEPTHEGEPILKLGQKHTLLPPNFGRMTITNIYLAPTEYDVLAMLPALELRKRRYGVIHNDRAFSIDVFDGALAGLILSETGFDEQTEMDQPLEFPSWVRSEVTTDRRFTGGELASLAPREAAALIREITRELLVASRHPV